ncbi:MAG: hypothetical protein M3R48_05715 [Candidatus Dormibacteraeota bacterium]|nr:hypothetical protein [Candidatus Dormibacteraeota bacterium]
MDKVSLEENEMELKARDPKMQPALGRLLAKAAAGQSPIVAVLAEMAKRQAQ